MKKLLLFLSFFAFTLSFSQIYTPLLKDGNKWWESLSEGYCDGCNAFSDGFYYFINGEEVINNITYKKIYVNYYYYCADLGPCGFTNNPDVFFTYMREDIRNEKVYTYDKVSNTEKLLYDFSLNVGEYGTSNWPLSLSGNNSNYKIEEIVSGKVFDRDVKNFQISFEGCTNCFYNIYEGIGSQSGLFSKPDRGPFELLAYWLQCFEDTSGKSCNSYFVLGTDENDKKKNLTLYYSKETEDFKIIDNKTQDINIKFYDFTGKILDEINTKTNQNFKLNNTYNQKILIYIISNKTSSWKGKIMF